MQLHNTRKSAFPAASRIRAELAASLTLYLMTGRVQRADYARVLNVPQGRVTDLLQGRLSLFSIEDLIAMAVHAGLTPKLSIYTL